MIGWIGFGVLFAAGCVALAVLFRPDARPPEAPAALADTAVDGAAPPREESAPAETAGAGPDEATAAAGETAAAVAPELTTIAGITNVRLRTGTGFAEADRDAVVAALGKAGLADVRVEPLPFAVGNSRVGYYRAEDKAAAETLAAYIAPVLGYGAPIAVRDYGALLEGAEPGRLDLWIGG